MSDAQLEVLAAQHALAEWVASLQWSSTPAEVRERLELVLADSLGVMTIGGRLPERAALVRAWDPPPGPAALFGTAISTAPEVAAWLNGSAMVSLELDEGNKYAGGHPAAHGFPAVLALAAHLDSDGPTTAAALLVAYEVAARFGRATSLRSGVHPHGNWGFAGAAAGCARLLGLSPAQICAAIDTAAGLTIAGPFSAATDGNPVRNEWIGASNQGGIAAARLAAAGLAQATGIAAHSLGTILGRFDAGELTTKLGERWDVELGYFKRHSSCAFTHPAADAALALRERVDPADIRAVTVLTYTAAAGLDADQWSNRLSAMFSIPFVTATALLTGAVRPQAASGGTLHDDRVAALAAMISVQATSGFDDALPDHRGARVEVTLADGRVEHAQVVDPVGDVANQPFHRSGLITLLNTLLTDSGPDTAPAELIWATAHDVCTNPSLRAALAPLTATSEGEASAHIRIDPALRR